MLTVILAGGVWQECWATLASLATLTVNKLFRSVDWEQDQTWPTVSMACKAFPLSRGQLNIAQGVPKFTTNSLGGLVNIEKMQTVSVPAKAHVISTWIFWRVWTSETLIIISLFFIILGWRGWTEFALNIRKSKWIQYREYSKKECWYVFETLLMCSPWKKASWEWHLWYPGVHPFQNHRRPDRRLPCSQRARPNLSWCRPL